MLGLLGESKNIKRYSKVSDFIKKDTGRSVIQVTLRNTGEDAYKPELYGTSLTFQRTIFETGSSAYLLKDQHMRDVVRKSKDAMEECRRILDRFQIQVIHQSRCGWLYRKIGEMERYVMDCLKGEEGVCRRVLLSEIYIPYFCKASTYSYGSWFFFAFKFIFSFLPFSLLFNFLFFLS